LAKGKKEESAVLPIFMAKVLLQHDLAQITNRWRAGWPDELVKNLPKMEVPFLVKINSEILPWKNAIKKG
jgi:hypothetical protein